MGTPQFAVPSLKLLIEKNYEVSMVVTQPDRPKGRGRKIALPPIKTVALQMKLPLLQPQKARDEDFIRRLQAETPDIICVVSYGQFLPEAILDIPRLGVMNVHPSMLPQYRGAAPINWAIIRGEQITGITTMFLNKEMDAGDILLQESVPIGPDDTAGELSERMSDTGAKLLARTIEELKGNRITPIPQEHSEATFAPKLTKEMANIDWSLDSLEIHNLVRGLDPWPGAYTYYDNNLLKIWRTEPLAESGDAEPGTILDVETDGLLVGGGTGKLLVKEVQLENRKRMPVKEFLLGHHLEAGTRFHP